MLQYFHFVQNVYFQICNPFKKYNLYKILRNILKIKFFKFEIISLYCTIFSCMHIKNIGYFINYTVILVISAL
jgi:hypothetical protein